MYIPTSNMSFNNQTWGPRLIDGCRMDRSVGRAHGNQRQKTRVRILVVLISGFKATHVIEEDFQIYVPNMFQKQSKGVTFLT